MNSSVELGDAPRVGRSHLDLDDVETEVSPREMLEVLGRVIRVLDDELARRGQLQLPPAPLCVARRTPRAREHRSSAVRKTRAAGEGSEPPRPRLAPRACLSCRQSFDPPREASLYCAKVECQRVRKAENKRDQRERDGDEYHSGLADAIRAAVEDGCEPEAALAAAFSDRVATALAIRDLVARTLAGLDHGKINLKAAAPVARAIFDELEADRARAA